MMAAVGAWIPPAWLSAPLAGAALVTWLFTWGRLGRPGGWTAGAGGGLIQAAMLLVLLARAPDWPAGLAWGLAQLGLASLALWDAVQLRLPRHLVWVTGGAVLGAQCLWVALRGDAGRLGEALLAAMILLDVFWITHLVAPRGAMGFGDVRLAALVGLVLGAEGAPVVLGGVVLALTAGLVLGGVLHYLRRTPGRTRVPLGPPMLLGVWLALVLHTPLTHLLVRGAR